MIAGPGRPLSRGCAQGLRPREFHQAWRVNKRGVAYLIGEPLQRGMTVAARDRPAPQAQAGFNPGRGDPTGSPLLYGEGHLRVRGDWVEVLADEHPVIDDDGAWQGYKGWVRQET